MNPLLTVGIPTYERPNHIIQRLVEFEKLRFLNNPKIEIIIHDNDSAEKAHCRKIRELQKNFSNLKLIESRPNVGMVRACEKILAQAKGEWITFLGDDDPILLPAEKFLNLIQKNRKCEHLFFRSFTLKNDKPAKIDWFPRLKLKMWNTSELCAKAGFTTHFAFLGAHCFRNKPNLQQKWRDAHERCMFYGHCVMLLENYKKSLFTGIPLVAWRPGNERISHQQNLFRHLEVKQILSHPLSRGMKSLCKNRPVEVVRQHSVPLVLHKEHPAISLFLKYEGQPKNKRIVCKRISSVSFHSKGRVEIFPRKKYLKPDTVCVFQAPPFSRRYKCALNWECGREVTIVQILRIISYLNLHGTFFYKNKKMSFFDIYRLGSTGQKNSALKKAIFIFSSAILFGPEGFQPDRILRNGLSRPRKGIYKILLEIEKIARVALKKMLGLRRYYSIKLALFGRKHFKSKLRIMDDFATPHQ